MNNESMTDRVNSQIEYFKDNWWFITDNISDWYHTFGELYKHRIHLFIALCKREYLLKKYIDKAYWYTNESMADVTWFNSIDTIIKSKKHFDWSEYEWWFIIQIETWAWQISYHLPNEYWDKCEFIETIDKANEWDWHDSNTVLERLLLI